MITMRKLVKHSVNDLWMLPKCVAVIAYIVMAAILLYFDLEISKSVKGVIVGVYFASNIILAYNNRKVLRKLKLYERILDERLSSGSFSDYKNKEICSLNKLHKSKVRSLSYPITSVEYRFFHPNWEHNAQNGLLRDNLYKLKSNTRIAALNKPLGTSCQVYHEIPAKLHKCVKDLDSVIQRVKSLNLDYSRILEDNSVVNQNLETVIKNGNQKNKIPGDEKGIQHKLESTNCVNEISCTIKNPSMKIWSPLKDLDSVIQCIKSLNLDYIRNLEDSSVLNLNSETATKNENLQNQIAKDGIRGKLESIKSTKEISFTLKSNGFLPRVTNHGLDTKDRLTKNIKIDNKNLHDTSVVNPNSEISAKIENLLNQIAKEGENIQGKLERNKGTKKISSTVKSNGFLPQATNHDSDTKDKLAKKTKTDYTKNLEFTSNANQNSDTVTKNKNLQNQIAKEEEDIQRKLESNECKKEISSTVKRTRFLLHAIHHDLNAKDKLTKKTKIDKTRNSEFASNVNPNSQILTQKGNIKNQIAEVKDIQHRCICPRHAKLFSSTVKRNILPQVPRQNLVTKDKLAKKTVLVPKNTPPAHCLLASMLEYEGTYFSLRRAKKFIRIIISLTVNTYFEFLIKRPLNKQNYNRLNDISNLEETDLIFYKTTAPIKHNTEAIISLKSLLKIPMKPYVLQISFTPHMRELSQKRYVNSVLMRESEMRKNNQNTRILKYIHRNTKFLTTCQIKNWNSVSDEMPLSFQQPDFMLDPAMISNEI